MAIGENNNLPVAVYEKTFKKFLQAVYRRESYFGEFFGNELEVLDGVKNNKTAFSVKTCDIPVVVGNKYDTGADVAFGTGTSNSNRFGPMTEIIYDDLDVPYDWQWVIHEGIDKFTVNNNLDNALADRLDLQAKAKVQLFDNKGGLFISNTAAKTYALADYTADSVLALFNQLSSYYINLETIGNKIAWVNAELYNAIVDHPLTTTGKNSTTNIDDNRTLGFKGFRIKETPDEKFQSGEVAYVSIEAVGKQFTGINTTRTIETPDFDGLALQGAGKAGEFILPDNKPAVVKVTGATSPKSVKKGA